MHKYINECGIVLINNTFDKILIIFQNESLKWGLPKGHMDPKELNKKAYFDCAKRELLEETGIMITTHKYRKLGTFVIKDKLFYTLQLLKDINIKKPIDTNEIGDVKWLPIKNILQFMKTARCNITLKELNQYIFTIYESHHKIANV
jgi:8-oxo-dGTP pyrophosphatase MutT (NUDIX family)